MAQFNGNRLKKARIYRGYTVAELAEKVQCQRQTLSMYEISKSQPADEQTIERLSYELNFPKDYFLVLIKKHQNIFLLKLRAKDSHTNGK